MNTNSSSMVVSMRHKPPWVFQVLNALGEVALEQRVRLDRRPFDIVANAVQTEHDFDFEVSEGEVRILAGEVGITFDKLSEEEEGFLATQIFTSKIEGPFFEKRTLILCPTSTWHLYNSTVVCIDDADYAYEEMKVVQIRYSGGILKSSPLPTFP